MHSKLTFTLFKKDIVCEKVCASYWYHILKCALCVCLGIYCVNADVFQTGDVGVVLSTFKRWYKSQLLPGRTLLFSSDKTEVMTML